MRVVVLGSSGFLGRSIVAELSGHGHDVIGVSRRGLLCPEAPGASAMALDVVATDEAGLDLVLAGADVVVYCLGPDDRERVPAPADAYFQRLLVDPTVRVAAAAARTGVARLVVLGSYFTAFDRAHPQWELAARHPYIQARRDQQEQARAAAVGVETSVLEIPFVFGALPGIVPMWKSYLVEPTRRSPLVAYAPTGTNAAVTNTDVAQAVSALMSGDVPAGDYPLATDNYSFARLTRIIADALGQPRKRVVTVPPPILAAGIRAEGWRVRLTGKDSGLTLRHLVHDILARDLSLDPTAYGSTLGLTPRSLDDVVAATVAACRNGP